MRIVHTVASIAEEASGLSVAVSQLCAALAARGHEVEVHALDTPQRPPAIPGVRTVLHAAVALPAAKLARSPAMESALAQAARTAEILHTHSLWLMPTIYPSRAVKGTACKLITSPHGTLAAWPLRRSWAQKRVMWHLLQQRAVERSDCLHATAESEVDDIRRAGLERPVAVIPNGVSVPSLPSHPRREGVRRLLFLGRVHPKKGIDVLLRSWRRVQDSFPHWELEIAGPDNDGHLAEMTRLARTLGVTRVVFSGPLYGERKQQAYLTSEVFVLPTHSENFAMTVAEALSHELPVITTRGAPWKTLADHGCGWWIDQGEEALVACLEIVLRLPPEALAAAGRRGRELVARDFSWAQVAERMEATYGWLLGRSARPSWVHGG